MAGVKEIEKAGTLFFLCAVFLLIAFVAFIKGAFCYFFPCYFLFLILSLIFLLWGIENSL